MQNHGIVTSPQHHVLGTCRLAHLGHATEGGSVFPDCVIAPGVLDKSCEVTTGSPMFAEKRRCSLRPAQSMAVHDHSGGFFGFGKIHQDRNLAGTIFVFDRQLQCFNLLLGNFQGIVG